ncbi:molecular chaperone [Halogeometricum borinquense DSM 11551]|uniref:Molecular chaperone n=2 Tax=Halogeometricum borinquense TaxID=60847 RepID=E4NRG5_HALBP|nr:Hsp20/alpha crystallin family protein [Halogeometricum borinquense]ADQ68006.1 molecular chaperone (small heat shock protein) [Halogeometricum borinquense DSM 11551]ELY24073.1 molecular chaperone [Halogeometricum borinquense DSM 11551]RYJ13074.1 Hsp20/alpha crystallin family protein [Halogeometricum borinquense]
MNRLKEFGESAARSVLERIGRGVSRVQEQKPLPYDLLESDDAYLVVFDAPGVQRSDVQVRFLNGEVQVRIDRFRDFHEGFEMRFPGRGLSLDGGAELPDDAAVDATGASATLTANGTLRVEIPKDEQAHDVVVTDEENEHAEEADSRADSDSTAGSDPTADSDSAVDADSTDVADHAGDGEDADEDALDN